MRTLWAVTMTTGRRSIRVAAALLHQGLASFPEGKMNSREPQRSSRVL